MIAKSGMEIKIVVTGLRRGEKLHEELVGTGENEERPIHPKISHTEVPVLDPIDVEDHWNIPPAPQNQALDDVISGRRFI